MKNIVENLNFPEIDEDSQLATPPTVLSGWGSQSNVLENVKSSLASAKTFFSFRYRVKESLAQSRPRRCIGPGASCQSGHPSNYVRAFYVSKAYL